MGYLQIHQHHLLFGDVRQPKLGSLSMLTTDVRNRKRCENERKNLSFMDAARHAPELRDKEKEHRFVDFLIGQQGPQKQLSGMRTSCMFLYEQPTAGRGEQVRNLRVCQRLNLNIDPVDDGSSSQQPMDVVTKDTGKTASGDTRLAAIAPHKNVRVQTNVVVSSMQLLSVSRCIKQVMNWMVPITASNN